MATIVTYTDSKPATNHYPQRIVSPSRQSACCFSDMEDVGDIFRQDRWEFRYRRCRTCGFTVRVIIREVPDAALAEEVRKLLATAFTRNASEL